MIRDFKLIINGAVLLLGWCVAFQIFIAHFWLSPNYWVTHWAFFFVGAAAALTTKKAIKHVYSVFE